MATACGIGMRAAGLLIVSLFLATILVEPVFSQPTRSRELDAHFHRAETAWRTGSSILEAKARIDRVVSSLPDDVEALKLRAQILMAMDRPREALTDARRAIRVRPGDGEAQLILSEAAETLGDTASARAAVESAFPNLPRIPHLFLRLSRTAQFVEAHGIAEESAREALALSQRDPAAHYQLATVLMSRNRPDAAAEVIANGARSGWVDVNFIRRDATLAPLLSHPLLNGISEP